MNKILLEYIWLDGNQPQQLRSKTKVVSKADTLKASEYPLWSFDGSSTNQAEAGKGRNTDCILKPVYVTKDPFRGFPHRLVLCEVMNPDGTPHKTNTRNKLDEFVLDNGDIEKEVWFGWEQEYTLTTKSFYPFGDGEGLPLGFTGDWSKPPRPQGDYYCGIGSDTVVGRKIVEEHMEKCLEIGLEVSGINAEVLLGQWEYQIGPVAPLNGSDQLWVSRYILDRVAEENNVNVSLHPKPLKGDWNGSGCHVNFSTKEMREEGGLKIIEDTMEKLKNNHEEHIKVYGLHNNERLSGEHETSSIHDFSYGYSTRDTSIRIPAQAIIDGCGYFEDRRPASNCDPYMVSLRMLDTVYNTVAETIQ
jgi:glutamine synthetase